MSNSDHGSSGCADPAAAAVAGSSLLMSAIAIGQRRALGAGDVAGPYQEADQTEMSPPARRQSDVGRRGQAAAPAAVPVQAHTAAHAALAPVHLIRTTNTTTETQRTGVPQAAGSDSRRLAG
jgi:hypothetical protein